MSSQREPDQNGGQRTRQLDAWTGHFGDDYVDRNDDTEWRVEAGTRAFQRMLDGCEVNSVLEVGSNIGLNLGYLNNIFDRSVDLYAVEPNRKAYSRLLSKWGGRLKEAWNCTAFEMPLDDSSIDMVFTAGVLIHVAPDDLGRATDEIVRVARRYVLCVEYFSDKPVEAPYRGKTGLFFKRDFGAFYVERYSHLKCIDYGFLWRPEFPSFGDRNWWLFEK